MSRVSYFKEVKPHRVLSIFTNIIAIPNISQRKSKSTQNISFIGVNCKMFNINLDEKVTNTDKPEYNIGIKFREKRVQQKEINNKKEEDNNDIED